jgi:NADPH2 dehydrogenase
VVDAAGADRVGLRLSPWSTFQGVRMVDLVPQYTDIVRKPKKLSLTFLGLIESRMSGSMDCGS